MSKAETTSASTIFEGLPRRERLEAIFAIAVSVAMATLDTAVTNTALPTIARDLGSNEAMAIWVINAYQLAMIAALLPLAALGDIVGHRRVYIVGLILFTATSLGCGIAWSLPSLIVARTLQGFGAAAIMSVNSALIRFVYPARTLGRGVGIIALVVALGFTLGPTVASIILSFTSWHWIFLINVPAGIIATFLCLRSLPTSERATHGFDGMAALLCAGFATLLIFGLSGLSHGSPPTLVLGEWAASIACLVVLVRRQAGHPAPMLAADLFRDPIFSLSTATAVCSFATQGLAFVSLPFLLQTTLGRSQVATGYLITPWPAVVAIMAPIAGRLSDRYPAGLLGGFGLLVLCLGMGALAMLPDHAGNLAIIACMIACGAGFGFFQSPNLRALMASAPPGRSGAASGIVATARLLGQTIGATLVALCLTLSRESGLVAALWLGFGFSALGSTVSFLRLLPRRSIG